MMPLIKKKIVLQICHACFSEHFVRSKCRKSKVAFPFLPLLLQEHVPPPYRFAEQFFFFCSLNVNCCLNCPIYKQYGVSWPHDTKQHKTVV